MRDLVLLKETAFWCVLIMGVAQRFGVKDSIIFRKRKKEKESRYNSQK
jgi:hypothetical protein